MNPAVLTMILQIAGSAIPALVTWIQQKLGYNNGTDAAKKQAVADALAALLAQPAILALFQNGKPTREEIDAAVEAVVQSLKATGVLPNSGTSTLTIVGGTLQIGVAK